MNDVDKKKRDEMRAKSDSSIRVVRDGKVVLDLTNGEAAKTEEKPNEKNN